MSLQGLVKIGKRDDLVSSFVAQAYHDWKRLENVLSTIDLNDLENVANFFQENVTRGVDSITASEIISNNLNNRIINALYSAAYPKEKLPTIIDYSTMKSLAYLARRSVRLWHIRDQLKKIHEIPLSELGLNSDEKIRRFANVFGIKNPKKLMQDRIISIELAQRITETFEQSDLFHKLGINPRHTLSILKHSRVPQTLADLMSLLNINLDIQTKNALKTVLGIEGELNLNTKIAPADIEYIKKLARSAKKIDNLRSISDPNQKTEPVDTQTLKNEAQNHVKKYYDFLAKNKQTIDSVLNEERGIPASDVPSLYSLFDIHERISSNNLQKGLDALQHLLNDYDSYRQVLAEYGIKSREEAKSYLELLDAYNRIKEGLNQIPKTKFEQYKAKFDPNSIQAVRKGLSYEETQELSEILDLSPQDVQEIAKQWQKAQANLKIDNNHLQATVEDLQNPENIKRLVEKGISEIYSPQQISKEIKASLGHRGYRSQVIKALNKGEGLLKRARNRLFGSKWLQGRFDKANRHGKAGQVIQTFSSNQPTPHQRTGP